MVSSRAELDPYFNPYLQPLFWKRKEKEKKMLVSWRHSYIDRILFLALKLSLPL